MTLETSTLAGSVENVRREAIRACHETCEILERSEDLRIKSMRLREQMREVHNAYQRIQQLRQP